MTEKKNPVRVKNNSPDLLRSPSLEHNLPQILYPSHPNNLFDNLTPIKQKQMFVEV